MEIHSECLRISVKHIFEAMFLGLVHQAATIHDFIMSWNIFCTHNLWKLSLTQNKKSNGLCWRKLSSVLYFSGYSRGLQSSAFQSRAEEANGADESQPKSGERHEAGADGEQQLKEEILHASLPFVHSLGWSEDAIAQGMHRYLHILIEHFFSSFNFHNFHTLSWLQEYVVLF